MGYLPQTTPVARAVYAKLAVLHALRVCALLIVILAGGFLLFANWVSTVPGYALRTADGIVALTGGEDRIYEAVRLLAARKAKRLLISGVNPSTPTPQLIMLNTDKGQGAFLFRCCVDLDRRALNTEDNAVETTLWAKQRGFRSLIVVTSSYHMPRSLVELRQAMPDVELIPYPVKSPALEKDWWRHRRTFRVLGKEYVKFVTALARYTAHSLLEDGAKPQSRTRTVDAQLG